MAKHKTIEERLEIVREYLNSNLSMREYSRRYGVASSTLSDWVGEYKKQFGVTTSGFINVTNEVKDNQIIESPGVTNINQSPFFVDESKQSINIIRIKHPTGVELEFDVSILDKVVKAIL